MLERFTSKDGHPPQVIESGDLLNPFQNDQTPAKNSTARELRSQQDLESGGLIDPFKKPDPIPDTMTLNPFERDKQHGEPQRFLNPFEDLQRPVHAGEKLDFASLHRPTFPEKVDGAEPYIVKPGDSLWKIAKDVLTQKTGAKPSATEVLSTVNAMAKILGESNPNAILLRPGDKVFVPLPKQSGIEDKSPETTTARTTGTTTPVDSKAGVGTAPADAPKQTEGSVSVATEAQKPKDQCTVDTPDGKEVSESALTTLLTDLAVKVKQQIVKAYDVVVGTGPATQANESPVPATQTADSCEPTTPETNDLTPAPIVPDLFSPMDGVYSPVRPPGIGELKAGESTDTDTNTGIDWRNSIGKRPENAHMTVYSYEGELEDSGWTSGDTSFKAEERVDTTGRIVSTEITYDTPVSIQFKSFDGNTVNLDKVSSVKTSRRDNGEYVSSVTSDGEKNYTFVTAADGTVTSFDFN